MFICLLNKQKAFYKILKRDTSIVEAVPKENSITEISKICFPPLTGRVDLRYGRTMIQHIVLEIVCKLC